MPTPPSEADEFGPMDSLFDDLDAELLRALDGKAARPVSDVVIKVTPPSQPGPNKAGKLALSKRQPLQPVSGNARSQPSRLRPTDVKGKARALDTALPAAPAKPATHPFRPTTEPPPSAPVRAIPRIPETAASSQPATYRTDGASVLTEARKKADADLLHDLDWSDDDDAIELAVQGALPARLPATVNAHAAVVAASRFTKAAIVKKSATNAAEQSSRLKAEQLAHVRRQPGYVSNIPMENGMADRILSLYRRSPYPNDIHDAQCSR